MTIAAPYIQTIAASVAGTDTGDDASFAIGTADVDGTVTGVTYAPVSDITGAATNNRKLELVNKGADGDGTTVVASLSFASGTDADAFDATAITLSGTAANLAVSAGDVLALVSTHVGTGIADPGGLVSVSVSRS